MIEVCRQKAGETSSGLPQINFIKLLCLGRYGRSSLAVQTVELEV